MKGYKRCKCRGEGGRELGNSCDKLRHAATGHLPTLP